MAGYDKVSERLGGRAGLVPGNPGDGADMAPMALELQDQFEATKSLLQAIAQLEQRLSPVLSNRPAQPGTETAPEDRPPMLAAVHENTRAVALGLSQVRDIMERLVI